MNALTVIPLGCVAKMGSTVCLSINGTSASLPQAAAKITEQCGPWLNTTGDFIYNTIIDMGGMTLRYAFQSVNDSSLGTVMGALIACGHTALSTITDPQLVSTGFSEGIGSGIGIGVLATTLVSLSLFALRKTCCPSQLEEDIELRGRQSGYRL